MNFETFALITIVALALLFVWGAVRYIKKRINIKDEKAKALSDAIVIGDIQINQIPIISSNTITLEARERHKAPEATLLHSVGNGDVQSTLSRTADLAIPIHRNDREVAEVNAVVSHSSYSNPEFTSCSGAQRYTSTSHDSHSVCSDSGTSSTYSD